MRQQHTSLSWQQVAEEQQLELLGVQQGLLELRLGRLELQHVVQQERQKEQRLVLVQQLRHRNL
jgi:hypothetical protein